jgi:hypothetical protein
MFIVLILVIAAIVFGVIGLFTAVKWLLIIAAVLLVISVVQAIVSNRRGQL